jgi:hypothetical protein
VTTTENLPPLASMPSGYSYAEQLAALARLRPLDAAGEQRLAEWMRSEDFADRRHWIDERIAAGLPAYCGCRIDAGQLVSCGQDDCGDVPEPPAVAEHIERICRENAEKFKAAEKLKSAPILSGSLADLLAAEGITKSSDRIDGLLPSQGKAICAAQNKAGKTTLVGNLVRCLVDGGQFLGRHETVPVTGRVFIIDTEMTSDKFREWLAAQGIVRTDRVHFELLRGRVTAFDIFNPERRQAVADYFRSLDVEVLIIDCLRPILDAFGLSENTGVGKVLVTLDELVRQAGVRELVVVHHMGHNGERSRGDSRLRDWPDVEWQLVRQDPNDLASRRYFKAYGRDVDVPENALDFDPVTRHITLAGTSVSRRDARADAEVARIVALLAAEPGLLSGEIEDRLKGQVPEKVTRAAIKRAIAGRQVIMKQDGRARRHYPASKIAEYPLDDLSKINREASTSENVSGKSGNLEMAH